jgi:hypothetical protein
MADSLSRQRDVPDQQPLFHGAWRRSCQHPADPLEQCQTQSQRFPEHLFLIRLVSRNRMV